MKYYFVSEIEITDRNWTSAYVANVTRLVEDCGGRFLARTSRLEIIEGEPTTPPQLLVIIEWPSKEVANRFYESDAYRPYRQSRIGGSKGKLFLVPGEDLTKTAQISG